MNNQNATLNAPSICSIESFDYALSCRKCAERKLGTSGITTGSHTLNRQKLISSVCADVRNSYPGLFNKRDDKGNIIPESLRLPEDVHGKICEAVDSFINKAFDAFLKAPDELVKVSTRFVHLAKKHDVVLRHTIQRDEVIALKERKLGITLFIGETKRQLDKLNSQRATWSELTAERVGKLEKRLEQETVTLAKLEEEIAKQSTLQAKS